MHRNKHTLISLLFALLLTISFAGCGSSGSSTPTTDTSKNLIGKISGNGYADRTKIERFIDLAIPKAYAVTTDQPDKIVIISNGKTYKYSISSDGSFTVKTADFTAGRMVALITNDTTKEVFGNLHLMASNSSSSLDSIDSSKMNSDINFGTVNTSGAGSTAQITQTISGSNAFSSEDALVFDQVALSDNAMLLYQNIYRNPDIEAGIHALYNMGALADRIGSYSDINSFSNNNLIGLRPTIKTTNSEFNNIDKDNIFLYPPSDTNYTLSRYGNFNQVAGVNSGLPSTYSTHNESNWYEFGFLKNFPVGDWLLKITGSTEVKGKFHYAAAYPFNVNGYSIVPVPTIKLNMDTTDNSKLKSIDVKWYVYSDTGYKQVSNEYMNSIASQDTEGFPTKILAPLRNNYGQTLCSFYSNTWNGNYTTSDDSSITLPAENRRINM